jgi:hypothetical protein
MKKNKEGVIFWPRYCKDQHCDFNVDDCPMLARLAIYLREGGALCDLSPNIPADVPIKAMQDGYDAPVNAIAKLPGAKAFDPQKTLKDSIRSIACATTASSSRRSVRRSWIMLSLRTIVLSLRSRASCLSVFIDTRVTDGSQACAKLAHNVVNKVTGPNLYSGCREPWQPTGSRFLEG